MQLDAWKSVDEMSQKRYIDNVFDVPAAKVLRPDREAFDETVMKIMNTTEIVLENLRFVLERVREDWKKFNTVRDKMIT